MNKSFKVVFSKARSALMVVNEATSSVQAKGTKTVVATAVAAMIAGVAGTAVAETEIPAWVDAPAAGETVYIVDVTAEEPNAVGVIKDLKDSNVFNVAVAKKTEFLKASDGDRIFDKKLWVIGNGQPKTDNQAEVKPNANGLVATDGATYTNVGTIYVESKVPSQFWSQAGMKAYAGGTVVNAKNGVIVTKNGYAMGFMSGNGQAATVENRGTIVVTGNGTGIDLGAGTPGRADKAVNKGTIYAQNEGAVGVIVDQTGGTFINNGVISAADGTAAIKFQDNNSKDEDNNGSKTVVLKSGSTTIGKILVSGIKTVADLTIEAGAGVTGDIIVNEGKITVTGDAGEKVATVDGDLLAKAGTTNLAGNLKLNNIVVGVAGDSDANPAVEASSGAVSVSGNVTAEKANVINGTFGTTSKAKVALTTVEVGASGAIELVSGQHTVESLTLNKLAAATLEADKVGNEWVKVTTLTNAGTVTVTGDAVSVKNLTNTKDGTIDATGDTLITITGDSSNAGKFDASGAAVEITGGTFENTARDKTNGAAGKYGFKYGMSAGTLTVENATVTNTGTLSADNIVLNEGARLNTAMMLDGISGAFRDTTVVTAFSSLAVNEGATFNVVGLNGRYDDAAISEETPADALILNSDAITLNKGAILVNDKSLADQKVVVNAGTLTVTGGD